MADQYCNMDFDYTVNNEQPYTYNTVYVQSDVHDMYHNTLPTVVSIKQSLCRVAR